MTMEIALARGRRSFDKRQAIAQRDADREIARELSDQLRSRRRRARGSSRENGQPPGGYDVTRNCLGRRDRAKVPRRGSPAVVSAPVKPPDDSSNTSPAQALCPATAHSRALADSCAIGSSRAAAIRRSA